MIEGQRVLLTGGAGFIGTALVRRLCAANHCVVFDTLRRNALQPAGLDRTPT
jgi:nucleoside-diphosphate-sugar epimerase